MTCWKQLRCHRGIGHAIHSHIDHGRARLYEVFRHKTCSPDSRDEDVGRTADGWQIRCPRMADGHRRVPMQEQHRHRLSHNVAATHDDGVPAGDRDLGPLEYLDHPRGRARHQGCFAQTQPADVHRVKTVHILSRVDRFQHRSGVDLGRQRKLHKNSVHVIAVVKLLDDVE